MQDHTMQLWRYEWMQQGRSEQTFRSYASEVRRFAEHIGKPLDSASVGDCLEYLTHKRESRSLATATFAWRSLRSYYACLAELDGTPSPMAKVKCPRGVDEPCVTGVEASAHKALIGACVGDRDAERDKALISLLDCTGLRRGEIANVMLADVNVEQGVIIVRKSKTGKPRVVPMSNTAKMALLRYLRVRAKSKFAESPFLWLTSKGHLTPSGVRQILIRRGEMAGVHVTAHQYRRSFAVEWLSKGGSQVSLMSICGWSSGAMPARYTRYAAGQVAEAEYRRLFPN